MTRKDMRTVVMNERTKPHLHIEAPGCIINIYIGLKDDAGRAVTAINISASGDRYAGETPWYVATEDFEGSNPRDMLEGFAVRVREG